MGGGGGVLIRGSLWYEDYDEMRRQKNRRSMTVHKVFHVVPLTGYKVFLLQVKCILRLN